MGDDVVKQVFPRRVRLQTAQWWSIKNDLIWEVEKLWTRKGHGESGMAKGVPCVVSLMVSVLVQTYSFSDLGLE